MKPTDKYCPSCNSRFLVDPSIPVNSCPSCGSAFKVNPALRDTDRTRGGFTIELLYGDVLRYKLLDFIFENPRTCADDCAMKFKRAPSSIRAYIKTFEAEDLVVVDRSRKIHRYSCSKYYKPTEKELEATQEKICVFCGKHTHVLKKGKCESCIAQQKLIYERFRELNRAAEASINERQRCKNAVTA